MFLFLLGGLFVCCGFVGRCLFWVFYFWITNHKDTVSEVANSVMDKRTVEL